MNANNVCSCGSVPAVAPNPDCERCCLVWFVDKTVALREQQARAAKTRRPEDIREARRVGSVVDSAIDRLLAMASKQELF